MAGKFPELGDDEFGNRGQVAVEQAQKSPRQHTQKIGGGTGVPVDLGFGRCDIGQHRLAHNGTEQILLGREIEVDGALADPGGGGNVLELGGGVATIGERGEGGGDNLTGASLLATGPDRRL